MWWRLRKPFSGERSTRRIRSSLGAVQTRRELLRGERLRQRGGSIAELHARDAFAGTAPELVPEVDRRAKGPAPRTVVVLPLVWSDWDTPVAVDHQPDIVELVAGVHEQSDTPHLEMFWC